MFFFFFLFSLFALGDRLKRIGNIEIEFNIVLTIHMVCFTHSSWSARQRNEPAEAEVGFTFVCGSTTKAPWPYSTFTNISRLSLYPHLSYHSFLDFFSFFSFKHQAPPYRMA